jgi:ABC-type multidrug transport system fused ATPase/permease subunit
MNGSNIDSAPGQASAAALARAKYRRDKKNNANFFRALRYLRPYRPMVLISIVCAFFVGLTMTGGLGTMLPIIRILINGDTAPGWIDRVIIEHRLGVKLNFDPESDALILLSVDKRASGWAVGLRSKQEITGDEPSAALRHDLADPDRLTITLTVPGRGIVPVPLKPVPAYLVWARWAVARLPVDKVKAIAVIFGVLASLALIGNVIRFFQEYLSNKAGILAVNDIRRHLYDHVLRVPMSHYGEKGASDMTSRLVQDSLILQNGITQVIGQTIQEPIKVVFGLTLALAFSWQLTLFIIGFAPIMALVVRKFGKKMYRASTKQLQKSSAMLGQLEATLQGIRVVKASVAERFERRRYRKIMDALVAQLLRMARLDAFNTPVLEMLLLTASGCVVLFGAYLVLKVHTLESDQFIAVMISLAAIGESLRRISKLTTTLQVSNAAAARIFEAMDFPVEQETKLRAHDTVKLRPLAREIRFENVCFTYPNASSPALTNVSLLVPKGRCVAVVGPNGSGKTTLLSLLPRLYDPQSGRITIDGVDAATATLRSLRRQISVVTQDSVIFPGTIAQNIAYGHPLAGRLDLVTPTIVALRQEIESAARRAFAHEFIMEKPQGYDTLLGELGGQLSGGQKQRLCIARAILRRTPILILDEATSQVDAQSEHLIYKAIDDLIHTGDGEAYYGPRTTFVIAHRLSTIRSADTIVVMDRGMIVAQGKHEELRASCATYQQLYERQFHAA